MSETTHIGHGPTVSVRRKRPMLPIALLAIAITGLVALAAIAAAYYFGQKLAAPSAAASPSPSIKTIGEEATCVMFVPVGNEAAGLIVEFAAHPDGSTTDWAKMEQVITNLKTIRDIADPSQRADIEAHIAPLEQLLEVHRTGANRTVNFDELRTAGLRLAGNCLQYAD